ncbi:MAG TPA: NAD(P)H-dependent oxidoreductase [Solirubrobacteraceae bacterium]|nr:NAD(P)H-dependent oxidoreductase [Solirubrobacteraceae bacterium]
MAPTCRILLISGSLRAASTNTALLRTACEDAGGDIEAVLYDGLDGLPHFNPDDDPDGGPVPPAVAELRAQIAGCDALLFCTPEYAGTLPGSFKNLLDWTVGGGETYGMPVGWVDVSGLGRGAGAHDCLRSVLTYTGTDVVEAACARMPVQRDTVGADGLIDDPVVRGVAVAALAALAARVAAGTPD